MLWAYYMGPAPAAARPGPVTTLAPVPFEGGAPHTAASPLSKPVRPRRGLMRSQGRLSAVTEQVCPTCRRPKEKAMASRKKKGGQRGAAPRPQELCRGGQTPARGKEEAVTKKTN